MALSPRQLQDSLNSISEELYKVSQEAAEIAGRTGVAWLELRKKCKTNAEADQIFAATQDGIPKNDKARLGIKILEKCISLIAESKPTWWFIENPRGMMRIIIDDIFTKYGLTPIRHTVTYCQYGAKIQKPTDIWTNAEWWRPKDKCSPGADCHERAGRGARAGVQGIYNVKWEKERGSSAMERGRIPPALFEEILEQMP